MKRISAFVIAVLLSMGLWAQKPYKLQVGRTGFATWENPDYLVRTEIDFNDAQLPEGWTLTSEGDVVDPWRFETPATNPQLDFPPDGSAYLYAHSDQLNGSDYMEEYFTSPSYNLSVYKRVFIQFDYDYFEDWDDTEGCCDVQSIGHCGYFTHLFYPCNADSGQFISEVTDIISSNFRLRFSYRSRYPDNHFAIDNVCILGEVEEPVSNNVLGFRLWLNDALIGDVTGTEYQIETDTLQEYHSYTLSVASILSDGISDTLSFSFNYMSCSHFDGVNEFHGEFIDSTRIKLTWNTPYDSKSKDGNEQKWFYQIPDVVTHPNSGYNNGWDISALHDGLTTHGFNADKDAGFMVMDKFVYEDGPSVFFGLRFYVYEGATPASTLTGAYLSIYDGDPLNGGQLIGGSQEINCLYPYWLDCYEWAHIYRTDENDFSDVRRPICYAIADLSYVGMGMELEYNHTYWFVASFTGSLRDDVHVIPVNRLNETITGEARIYSEAAGWQPIVDSGTRTQQGIAFDIIGYLPATLGVAYSDIFRDGERIAHGVSNCHFIDENVTHGIHTYSIQNIYENNIFIDYASKSCLQSIEVRPCYPPKNLLAEADQINGDWMVNHLTWDKEEGIPLRDDVKTFYEIYRKRISEEHFMLVGTLAKDSAWETFEYCDTVPKSTYYYKVNDYNVFPSGSCQSDFAGEYGEWLPEGLLGAEAEWDQGSDGVRVEWGEELYQECFHFDTGEFVQAIGGLSNEFTWGVRITDVFYLGRCIKSISFYAIAEGEYDLMFYTGNTNPNALVKQQTVMINGANQWHTIVLDEPYQINVLNLWVMIHQNGIENPAVVATDDNTSTEGRWWSFDGYCFYNTFEIGGSFMVKVNLDNLFDGEELLQMEEPNWGFMHYNLYRAKDNGDFEKIVQFPYYGNWWHVTYFDSIDDFGQSCYSYKITQTYLNEDGTLCETSPFPNANDPTCDYVEVCNAWNLAEETGKEGILLYPNPTTGILTISMNDFHHTEVYDLMGRLMKQSSESTFNLDKLPVGLYVVKITDKAGNIQTQKVIIQ